MAQKIVFQKTCKIGDKYTVSVEPPSEKMTLELFEENAAEPFQHGEIKNKRCPEIAVFMFKPRKLTEGGFTEPLKPGPVLAKAVVYDDAGKKHEASDMVEVTAP